MFCFGFLVSEQSISLSPTLAGWGEAVDIEYQARYAYYGKN